MSAQVDTAAVDSASPSRAQSARPWIGLVFRLALAGILASAGAIKLFEQGGAREAILAYRIFPVEWASALGWILPSLEVILALLLAVGLLTRWAALTSALLMAAFIVGIASVWIRGYNIDCGCFGGGGDVTSEGRIWRYSSEILRDFLFLGMSVWLGAWPMTRFSLDRFISSGPIGPGGSSDVMDSDVMDSDVMDSDVMDEEDFADGE